MGLVERNENGIHERGYFRGVCTHVKFYSGVEVDFLEATKKCNNAVCSD